MIRIAIVDDHQMFRDGLKAIISTFEEVEVGLDCANGKEFLDQMPEDLDIVLMDLDMPEMNGLECMEFLRQKNSNILVIFISQNKESSMIGKLMELGARGYLLKDSSSDMLKDAIYSVAETGYYFNELVSSRTLIELAGKDQIRPLYPEKEALSDRESEVLQKICEEMTTSEIGEALYLSPKTIENYRSNIMSKTGARNSAGLVVYAIKNNIYRVA